VLGQTQTTPGSSVEFVPFNDFLAGITAADSAEFLGRSTSRVKDAASFEAMRQHILTMYEGVEVSHSFVLDSSHFDCIPIMQQPTVRLLGIKSIASPPPQSMLAPPPGADDEAAEGPVRPASQIDPEKPFDDFGNSVVCEANTIPMRRLTLEEMTRFPTLRQFLSKGPDGAGEAVGLNRASLGDSHRSDPAVPSRTRLEPCVDAPPNPCIHKYSLLVNNNVNNLGGNSNLNVWSPYVDTSRDEATSISQEWYTGGSGTTLPGLQTAEVGWINVPAKFNSENSKLFIYWTANGYNGTGCYNLDCAAFLQVAAIGDLGAGFANYSTVGGTQYEFSAEYRLFNGNWWLAIQGTWIGYYPGSIYKGGQLTQYATVINFGSETTGTTVWPPGGSGNWPSKGYGYAAYQRRLFYINTSGDSVWDSLTPQDNSPNCYTTSGPFSGHFPSSSSGSTVYFFDGGPGGSGC